MVLTIFFLLSSCDPVKSPQGFFISQDPYVYYVTDYTFDDGEVVEQRAEMEFDDKILNITIAQSSSQLSFIFEGYSRFNLPDESIVEFEYQSDGSMMCNLLHPDEDAYVFSGKTSFVLHKVQ